MTKNTAERLMQEFLALSEPLSAATLLTEQIADGAERAVIRRGIGEIMNIVYVDLMRPVIRQYPDLDPDRNAK